MFSRPKFRRVFVATDLSPMGNLALPLALAEAARGAKILLFHAVEPAYVVASALGPEGPLAVYDPALTRRQAVREQRELARLAAGSPGVKVLVLESAKPYQAIVREARRFKADLLVMMTHGRSGLSKLLFGSVAQKVLAHYKGAVMLLRPRAGR
jgi:nucleotide-binding universal stress UspA family protein